MEVILPEFVISGTDKIDSFSGEVVGQVRETRSLLYISGPMYSEGHLGLNINVAAWAAQEAYRRGWAPVVPHCDVLLPMITGVSSIPRYMDVDLALIKAAEAVLVLNYAKEFNEDGTQTGTSEELDYAESIGRTVYTMSSLPWLN